MLCGPDDFESSLSFEKLQSYLCMQLGHIIPDGYNVEMSALEAAADYAMKRYLLCGQHVNNKYFTANGKVFFNHLNGDHYSMYLYFLSNELHKRGVEDLAIRFYYLNKILHSVDVFYETEMPDIFLFGHALGSVLGRGRYDNYFVVSQNCTVGNNDGAYPVFKEGVVMYAGAMVAGNCTIGENTHIAAQCFIRNQNTEGNCVAFGSADSMQTKPTDKSVKEIYFKNC